jgi:hypothetical protein
MADPIYNEAGEAVGVASGLEYANPDREQFELWEKHRAQQLERQRKQDYLDALRRERDGYRARIASLTEFGDQQAIRICSDPSGHLPTEYKAVQIVKFADLIRPFERDLARIEAEIEKREAELQPPSSPTELSLGTGRGRRRGK